MSAAFPAMKAMELADLVDLNEPMCRAYWLGQFVVMTTLCKDKIVCSDLRIILRHVGIRNHEFVQLYEHITGKVLHTTKDDDGIKSAHGLVLTAVGVILLAQASKPPVIEIPPLAPGVTGFEFDIDPKEMSS